MTMAGALPVTASSAETGSAYAVNDAWDAFTYVYSPPPHLVVVSLGLICNVGIDNRPNHRGDDPHRARRHGPGVATEYGRTSCSRCRGGACRTGPAWSPAMIDEIAAVGFQTR